MVMRIGAIPESGGGSAIFGVYPRPCSCAVPNRNSQTTTVTSRPELTIDRMWACSVPTHGFTGWRSAFGLRYRVPVGWSRGWL